MLYTYHFLSCQGEGHYTGYPSIWLRTYLCNLECRGFGQDQPASPETHEPVGNEHDLINIVDITDLPVFQYGCDSAYSVSKNYRHLQTEQTVEQVAAELDAYLPIPGVWNNQDYEYHMVFTGGEPLLKRTQKDIAALLCYWKSRPDGMRPRYITFETNGTQRVIDELAIELNDSGIKEVLFSFSPKLNSVSGELNKKAIKPDAIHYNLSAVRNHRYTLKFVLTPEQAAWNELDQVIDQIGLGRKNVWIMPVGGRLEEQEVTAGAVAKIAINKGYKVAARVHTYLFGNQPKT